ncbi:MULTISPECIES: pyridoxal phosphate-dependent decarboxylase family protein [unclassified Streptomyces]|uniref:pyridoxal phosphate-dependent decarboxylase family protein n=1 Tax=unclassified Streptomyces TaxID=2593676 RepID=UPI00224DE3E2|nr:MULTISPECIES: aminotransferase class V-fold PLP-dependent enzyme [unclassified Streptomyces]WSP54515.1 aminotransferase class V-fold PLP-dependent enzyme [Streptomyces sp. NBC_01241]WSU24808.1 aminotransferase class V-fold PLP-dependent enzyme [Streptomyces sp. NBC_01108]MCX4786054.1 aminotransferase class V-fold PLP-dependent enzyme [Streptomyces sp. NBC_01221]MCX4798089.1 aminotransferase class V-fold PLP-dependent enzyme [Streptomyces sp. NBC_01242]WSJ39342.1 aminotransferase class V-fol
MPTPPLAGSTNGPAALRPLIDTVLTALHDGAQRRDGPLPAGGPDAVTPRTRTTTHPVIPDHGTDPHDALRTLVTALAEGAADPAHPLCAAHLHTPPLALATAADLAASALNPSMDSWDQAPAASTLEADITTALATEIYPHHPSPDALVTTGGTEANQLALLLARERNGPVQTICAANAHHSISRAAWLLGLPTPVVIPAPTGVMDLTALDEALTRLHSPHRALFVTATAGTTDTGQIDPLADIADLCTTHGAELHIDAAYGGPLLFSPTHRGKVHGLDRAHSVTLDLHKLGWQPASAGILAVPHRTHLHALHHRASYLNADDDTEAGLPDLLGRSLRTTRRPDALKIAVTLKALGRTGLADLIDRTIATAHHLADLIAHTPTLDLYDRPTISTVLFRPTDADDHTVATIRRTLLTRGHAVLGRAHTDDRLWLKATLLNPHTTPDDLRTLLALVTQLTTDLAEGNTTR